MWQEEEEEELHQFSHIVYDFTQQLQGCQLVNPAVKPPHSLSAKKRETNPEGISSERDSLETFSISW